MTTHAPPDPPKKGANLFERFDYLVKAVLWLVEETLNTRHQLEAIMATVQDLQAALDANTAATDAAATAISAEIDQVKAAVDALAAAAGADLQPQVDQVKAATAKLQTAVDALNADDTQAQSV